MIKAIRDFFASRLPGPHAEAQSETQALQLATGVLLVSVMRADGLVEPAERAGIQAALAEAFELGPDAAAQLLALAEAEEDHAVSLQEFTRLLNEHLSGPQRAQVVELCWRVAYADGVKEAHEEQVVRKVASLLHVPHRLFIAARMRVEASRK